MEFYKFGVLKRVVFANGSLYVDTSGNSVVLELCIIQPTNQDVLCVHCLLRARLGTRITRRQQPTNQVSCSGKFQIREAGARAVTSQLWAGKASRREAHAQL